MKVLVFQHIAIEHPGIFRDFLREDGIAWDTVELDMGAAIPELEDYAALIVMGGPMDVWQEREHPWLIAEKQSHPPGHHGFKDALPGLLPWASAYG